VDAELVPMFEGFPRNRYNTIALRFVVPPENYEGYDYIYVTDIDLFFMWENVPFDLYSEQQMLRNKMCYFNSTRNKHHYQGTKSLSGLHFATQEWFEKTEKERASYYDLLESGLVGTFRELDGQMLYRMCERSGVGIPPKTNLIKLHHGIHLGSFRLFPDDQKKWEDRISHEFRIQWLNLLNNKKFCDLIEQCGNDSEIVKNQVKQLTLFCSGL
jgi:hypothetical protein